MFHADLNRTLVVAADLLNTAEGARSGSPSPDELTTVESLRSFVGEREAQQWPVGRLDRAQLGRVLALRDTLHSIWSATPLEAEKDLTTLNGLLEGVGFTLTTGEGDGGDSEVHAAPVPVSPELADVMTAQIAYALSQLVILDESARLRTCRGEDCEAKIVDLTRNRSKLFCDFGNCANRAHVRAYRARKAAEREAARRSDKSAPADEERLAKPSAKDKAAQLDEPTSESAVAAKEFRSRMRDELMDSRAKQDKKKDGKKSEKKSSK
ncbi:MAG: CGNR zinc finger domain-containing protein [Nesterenkonia sp.]|nr:CGNR zinc finger domain-containing protein [Nesterenkonia sp.]